MPPIEQIDLARVLSLILLLGIVALFLKTVISYKPFGPRRYRVGFDPDVDYKLVNELIEQKEYEKAKALFPECPECKRTEAVRKVVHGRNSLPEELIDYLYLYGSGHILFPSLPAWACYQCNLVYGKSDKLKIIEEHRKTNG